MIQFLKSAWSSDIATGAGSAFAIQVGGLFIGYLSSILLTRVMGPTEYGVYAYALSVVLVLLTLGASSVQLLNVRFVPEYFSTGRWQELKGMERFAVTNLTLISIGMAGVGSVLLLIWPSIVRAEYHLALLIALWTLPAWMILRAFSSMARAYGKITRSYLPQRLLRALDLGIAAGIALLLGQSFTGAQATIISLIVIFGLMVLQIIFHLQLRPPELRGITPIFHRRQWLWVGLPLFISSVATSLQTEGATIIVGSLMTADDVGLFSIAYRISVLGSFPLMALSAVAIPRIAALFTQGDKAGIQLLTRRVAIGSTIGSAVIVGALIVFTPLILLLFGPEFAGAKIETYLLSAAFLVMAAAGPGYSILSVTGYEKEGMIVALISAAVQIVGTIVGVIYFGSIGAAAAVLLTTIISGILQNIATIRALGIYTAIFFHLAPMRSDRSA